MDAPSQRSAQDSLSTATVQAPTSSLDRSVSLQLSRTTESPTPSVLQQAPDSNEGAEAADVDKSNDTDSVSTLSPEVPSGFWFSTSVQRIHFFCI